MASTSGVGPISTISPVYITATRVLKESYAVPRSWVIRNSDRSPVICVFIRFCIRDLTCTSTCGWFVGNNQPRVADECNGYKDTFSHPPGNSWGYCPAARSGSSNPRADKSRITSRRASSAVRSCVLKVARQSGCLSFLPG